MLPDSNSRNLTPEKFAILPWGNTPGDPAVLMDIKRCGFNLAGFVHPNALDAVREAGLKAIIFDESIHVSDVLADLEEVEIDSRVRALAAQVKDHPALFGYYLRDEPSASIFPGLRRWAKALCAADPHARPYINLFPNYATTKQLGVQSYQEHVELFLQHLAPPFLSYDHYALMEGGTLRGGYFQNLELIRAIALQHGIPFWNIVLSNTHYGYAEPTLAGLRFQAYTTLAYGAGGICYYTYFSPDRGNYRLAPIDQFGDKTPTWAILRHVNLQIHRLGPVYLQLKSINVFHVPDIPEDCHGIESSRYLDEVSGGSFVVGEFVGPGDQPYVMVVNKELQHTRRYVMSFKETGKIWHTSPYSGETRPLDNEDCWLAPGQGVLLSLAI